MAESIQCYQCGTRVTLAELVKNHDDCPECGATHTLSDVSKAIELNTRAQLPSQGGEAVEVVAWRHCGDKTRLLCDLGKQRAVPGTIADEFTVPLMTVAQHQRILAAATHPADQVADDLTMVKVSRELLERLEHVTRPLAPHLQCHAELRAILEAKDE